MSVRRRVVDPDNRTVVLTNQAWEDHIVRFKPEMAKYEDHVMETITHPDERADDEKPGRERFYREGRTHWLRVVVAYEGQEGEVVTAFWHPAEPV